MNNNLIVVLISLLGSTLVYSTSLAQDRDLYDEISPELSQNENGDTSDRYESYEVTQGFWYNYNEQLEEETELENNDHRVYRSYRSQTSSNRPIRLIPLDPAQNLEITTSTTNAHRVFLSMDDIYEQGTKLGLKTVVKHTANKLSGAAAARSGGVVIDLIFPTTVGSDPAYEDAGSPQFQQRVRDALDEHYASKGIDLPAIRTGLENSAIINTSSASINTWRPNYSGEYPTISLPRDTILPGDTISPPHAPEDQTDPFRSDRPSRPDEIIMEREYIERMEAIEAERDAFRESGENYRAPF